MENKKYYIITYGCQMNLHESEKIAGILSSMGYVLAENVKQADVIVFNTCCIRENAEQKAEGNIGALKQLKKNNKNLIVAVGGCMTQQKGYAEKLHKEFPFVDIIFGTHNLEKFKVMMEEKAERKKTLIEVEDGNEIIYEGTPKTRSSYPNAWVNIMYGCNNFCTYCIVPYVRGREKSRSPKDILSECESLIKEGYKEITLLGQNVNSYGKNTEYGDFPELLAKVAELDGDFRLRYMTNHPKDLSDKLIDVIKSHDKICKSIHLPIQSGSDKILKAMNRHYTKADYLEKVNKLRAAVPDIAITTDVMVGFPNETEEDFEETFSVMKEVGYAGAFTFIYSRRSGTPAAEMEGQIDEETGKKRIMKLIAYQNAFNRKTSKNYEGKTVRILCEGYDDKKKKYLGRDEYGRMAYFDGNEKVLGNFVDVKIVKAGGISLYGELVKGE
ncbi:MAG: tRNA (N6-isopentenyl adenosine(37)-C2)-methylthiotransferase MiaB [Candidatus Borkfalkiaceae bacterium]|nr:tRNA (N6-isopentenyl adenosine(37)-C2)-methylthiotransferase MiaB [Christensenellaceae bacterium]